MKTRRQFIQLSIKFLSGLGLFFSTIGTWLTKAYAKAKRILVPKGTDLSAVDNGKISVTPIDLDFTNRRAMKTLAQALG